MWKMDPAVPRGGRPKRGGPLASALRAVTINGAAETGERILAIHAVRNPGKLRHLQRP
jgi:hypothetical protein